MAPTTLRIPKSASSFYSSSHNSPDLANGRVIRSWTYKKKWTATAIVSAFTFISPVSSSMIAPASAQLAKDFGITSSVVEAMVTSVFILGYGTLLSSLLLFL